MVSLDTRVADRQTDSHRITSGREERVEYSIDVSGLIPVPVSAIEIATLLPSHRSAFALSTLGSPFASIA
jgi:hypothetical protein